ncbi:MAG: hypothetical protein Q9174_005126, partial [Haloplaca sp. 1 TL-2023]
MSGARAAHISMYSGTVLLGAKAGPVHTGSKYGRNPVDVQPVTVMKYHIARNSKGIVQLMKMTTSAQNQNLQRCWCWRPYLSPYNMGFLKK